MNVSDIMTWPVVSITPDTPVHEIAQLLLAQHISGVPVIEAGRVVGLVNEFELVRRHEIGTDTSAPRKSWWAHLMERGREPLDYVKSHAQQARDLMVHNVVTVTEDTPLPKLATMFADRAVRRIVVLRGQHPVGIVTRADLVRALARHPLAKPAPQACTDEAIHARLVAELEQQPWWHGGESTVYVRGGVVHYRGLIHDEDERCAARVAAENVPGVRGVEDTREPWNTWQSMV